MTLIEFCQKYNFTPRNFNFFKEALTHSTYSNEHRESKDYQRLEFLGDAVLSLIVSEKIFYDFPHLDEGDMSLLKSNLVSSQSLAQVTIKIGLINYIKVGKSLKTLITNQKILADVFEAFLAAIFLDQGIKITKSFLHQTLLNDLINIEKRELKNPKTLLQEHLQSSSRKIIEYETVVLGKGFISTVLYDGMILGHGKGKTKQLAEVKAAEDALRKFTKF